ncbi:MAG TPA: AbrB/MazE/SpoVT family DNA-binding domain-containing protein [archaeon]|nr:AbrB/MazE/SpoVT family DNA-binding domain-containing protein [archaeon]
MTKLKVGPKGQITLIKKLREKFGIKPGSLVEEVEADDGILIKPIEPSLKMWKNLKEKVSKKWPPDISSVQAIQEDRTK